MTTRDPVRQRILTAARELFAQHGYEGTSVRDITARAKANLAAITYHFGSKEALFHAVISSVAEPLVEAVTQAAQAQGTPLQRIEMALRAANQHVQANPWAPPVMLRELAGGGRLPEPLVQAWKRNITTLVGLITAGQQDGSIRAGDPLLLALSAVGQVFFFRVGGGRIAQQVAKVDLSDPEVRSRVIEHIAETVRRSLANLPMKAEP
jgi:TetR/AcrR family transcriptional regulator